MKRAKIVRPVRVVRLRPDWPRRRGSRWQEMREDFRIVANAVGLNVVGEENARATVVAPPCFQSGSLGHVLRSSWTLCAQWRGRLPGRPTERADVEIEDVRKERKRRRGGNNVQWGQICFFASYLRDCRATRAESKHTRNIVCTAQAPPRSGATAVLKSAVSITRKVGVLHLVSRVKNVSWWHGGHYS